MINSPFDSRFSGWDCTLPGSPDGRRGAHLRVDRERREEARELLRPHLPRMPPAVKQDVAPDPADVGLLGPPAVVPRPDALADAIAEPRSLPVRGRAFADDRREGAAAREDPPRTPPCHGPGDCHDESPLRADGESTQASERNPRCAPGRGGGTPPGGPTRLVDRRERAVVGGGPRYES